MSFTTINYNEGTRDLKYKSVEVHYGKNLKEKIFFKSGDFVKDWYDRVKFIIMQINDEEYHTCSSSVNHFIMDGAYETAWLKGASLVYEDFEEHDGIELFVPEGTKPTWEELREMCGDPMRKPKPKKGKNGLKKTKRPTK
jgi:hypothetical protein